MTEYSQAIIVDSTPRSRVRVSSMTALLLPNFSIVVFIVTLIQVLFLSSPQSLFRDSDTGWHIRNGEAIIDTLAPPRLDQFSYTREGRPWFSWEWLSDALLGTAHRASGPAGVALVAAIAIALTAAGVAHSSLSLGGNFFFTAAAMVLLLGTTSIHWLARPHIFSWLLALAFVSVAEHERRKPGSRLYILPFLACLWANLHASFLLGPAILFIYAMGEWLARWNRKNQGRRFAIACLTSLLATFLNPYGWRLHDHVLTYLQDDYLMNNIAEFRSFSFHAAGALYVELFLLVAVLGTLALLRQRAFGPALLTIVMIHMALYSARHLPTAAVVLLPLCIAALSAEVEHWPRLRPLVAYSEGLRTIDRKIWGFVPLMLVLTVTFIGISGLADAGRIGFDSAKFPARAADFLERNGAAQDTHRRVFAKDQWGGYLIYRFAGHMKVFVDGRSDFYGRDFLETYAQVMEVRPGWETVLNQYDVRFVLVPPENALAAVLQLSANWKQVYRDHVAAVYERVDFAPEVRHGLSAGPSAASRPSGFLNGTKGFSPSTRGTAAGGAFSQDVERRG